MQGPRDVQEPPRSQVGNDVAQAEQLWALVFGKIAEQSRLAGQVLQHASVAGTDGAVLILSFANAGAHQTFLSRGLAEQINTLLRTSGHPTLREVRAVVGGVSGVSVSRTPQPAPAPIAPSFVPPVVEPWILDEQAAENEARAAHSAQSSANSNPPFTSESRVTNESQTAADSNSTMLRENPTMQRENPVMQREVAASHQVGNESQTAVGFALEPSVGEEEIEFEDPDDDEFFIAEPTPAIPSSDFGELPDGASEDDPAIDLLDNAAGLLKSTFGASIIEETN
jgi:hypothetical protein